MVLFAVAILAAAAAAAAAVVEVMLMNTMTTTFTCYSHVSISTSYVHSLFEKQRTGLNPSCTV